VLELAASHVLRLTAHAPLNAWLVGPFRELWSDATLGLYHVARAVLRAPALSAQRHSVLSALSRLVERLEGVVHRRSLLMVCEEVGATARQERQGQEPYIGSKHEDLAFDLLLEMQGCGPADVFNAAAAWSAPSQSVAGRVGRSYPRSQATRQVRADPSLLGSGGNVNVADLAAYLARFGRPFAESLFRRYLVQNSARKPDRAYVLLRLASVAAESKYSASFSDWLDERLAADPARAHLRALHLISRAQYNDAAISFHNSLRSGLETKDIQIKPAVFVRRMLAPSSVRSIESAITLIARLIACADFIADAKHVADEPEAAEVERAVEHADAKGKTESRSIWENSCQEPAQNLQHLALAKLCVLACDDVDSALLKSSTLKLRRAQTQQLFLSWAGPVNLPSSDSEEETLVALMTAVWDAAIFADRGTAGIEFKTLLSHVTAENYFQKSPIFQESLNQSLTNAKIPLEHGIGAPLLSHITAENYFQKPPNFKNLSNNP
jgi:hypothetical protein